MSLYTSNEKRKETYIFYIKSNPWYLNDDKTLVDLRPHNDIL